MEVKILVNEKDTLELELNGIDPALGQLLAEKLTANSEVAFAACKLDHPVIGSPKLLVKAKKGDASKLVSEALDEVRKEVKDFQKTFGALVK